MMNKKKTTRHREREERKRARERAERENQQKKYIKRNTYKRPREESNRERENTQKLLSLLIGFLRVFMYVFSIKLYIYIFEWCLTTVKLISLKRKIHPIEGHAMMV